MEIDPENIVHVVPVKDDGEHLLECIFPVHGLPYCKCKCNPRYEFVKPSGMVVVHDAFDGRLGVEWAKELLK